jgi:hypothetical protein
VGKMSNKDYNSLILMLGILNGKLDEIIELLKRLDGNGAKRVTRIEHIERVKRNTQ